MQLKFSGGIFEWRGPAPFYFVRVADAQAAKIKAVAAQVTYGWGVIPCSVKIGKTTFETSLFPKDGGYLVPIKNVVRLPEKLV
ncbi:MAG: DUF1905 domain-containing protein, partial [Micrococcales bacterium]